METQGINTPIKSDFPATVKESLSDNSKNSMNWDSEKAFKDKKKQDKKINDLQQAIQKMDDRHIGFLKDAFTYLGIFALVFTFIAIDVTIFSKIENLFQAIVFIILFAWCLISIVYFVLRMKDGKTGIKLWGFPFLSLSVLFVLSLISYKFLDGFTFKGNIPTEKTEKKQIQYNQSLYIK